MRIKKKFIIASLSLLAMISLNTGMKNPVHSIHSPMITANAKIYDDTITNRIKRTGYYYDPVAKVSHYIKAGTPLYGGRYGDWYGGSNKYQNNYISGFVGSPKNVSWLVPDKAFKAPTKSPRRSKKFIHRRVKRVKTHKLVRKPKYRTKFSLKKYLRSHSESYDRGFLIGFKNEENYLNREYYKRQHSKKHYVKPVVRHRRNYYHARYNRIKPTEWGKPVKHSLNGGNSSWWHKPHYVMTDRNVLAYRIISNPNLSASAKIVGTRMIPKGKIIKGQFTQSTPQGFNISNASLVINPAYRYGIGNGNERLAKYPNSTYWIARVK